jgi:hypothetical protein
VAEWAGEDGGGRVDPAVLQKFTESIARHFVWFQVGPTIQGGTGFVHDSAAILRSFSSKLSGYASFIHDVSWLSTHSLTEIY